MLKQIKPLCWVYYKVKFKIDKVVFLDATKNYIF